MKLILVPRLPACLSAGTAGQAGRDKQLDLGLIYAAIIVFILFGAYIISRVSEVTGNEAFAPLNLAKLFACPLKTYIGIPCLTCGMTRAVVLFAHLKLTRAFLMNPIVFLTIVVLLLWGIYTLATRLLKTRRIVVQLSKIERKIVILIFIGVLLTNWLYLILDGR